jgi:hypothetical protein
MIPDISLIHLNTMFFFSTQCTHKGKDAIMCRLINSLGKQIHGGAIYDGSHISWVFSVLKELKADGDICIS